jgi:hypothetical protein
MMANDMACLRFALATTYWLQAFSSTLAGFAIIDLHDSRGTAILLGRNGVLAVVAVLTSALSLLHAGSRLSCLMTFPSMLTARTASFLLVEMLATMWTATVFAVVTSVVMESSKVGDKCTTTSGDGATSDCMPSSFELGCMAFATASAVVHLVVLVVLWWSKATPSNDSEIMATMPTPLSASKYAASSLEKLEVVA